MRRSLVVVVVAGCYAPTPHPGAPCGPNGACPAPLVCSPATATCEPVAIATDAARPLDARIARDGAPVCVPGAFDEDGDGIANNCDNCPTVPNPTQADTTEVAAGGTPDGVGDACDPHPTGQDRIAFFEGFDAPLVGWTGDPGVTVSAGKLHVVADGASDTELNAPRLSAAGVAVTRYTIEALPTTTRGYRSVEVHAQRGAAGTAGGYRCMVIEDPQATMTAHAAVQEYIAPYDLGTTTSARCQLAVGQTGELHFAYGTALDCATTTPRADATAVAPETRTGVVGLHVQTLSAAYDYLIVYEPR